MIKGRTPNIHTEQLRSFANKLVASANNKYGNRAISKEKFNKLLEHAPVQFSRQLRSQKSVSTYQTKKFLGDFLKHIQEHPEYKVSTYARKALNVKLHQGDNVIEHFDPEHVGEKGLAFVAKMQQEADAAKNTGPSEEEQLRQQRRERAAKYLNLYRSKQQRDAEASGKKTFTPTSISSGQGKLSTTSATSHAGAGTIAGARKVAGAAAAAKARGQDGFAPGTDQHAPQQSSNRPVQLSGGIGRHSQRGPSHAPAPGTGMPVVGAPDLRQAPPAAEEAPAPAVPDEVPSTADVDKNLPLAP